MFRKYKFSDKFEYISNILLKLQRLKNRLIVIKTNVTLKYFLRIKSGLWATYITILMNGMFFETGKLRSVLKDVGEHYQSSVRNLRRNIYKNTPIFSVHQIIIQDNEMAIDLNIDNPSQKSDK